MAKKKDQKKGVFCLEEAAWFGGIRDTTSVEPVLRLLKTTKGYRVPYLHFDVGTREEFDFYLKKWRGTSFRDTHPILYLGFHGARGELSVGEGRDSRVTLSELAERLDGSCRGRVIHFGSCSTLAAHGRQLSTFLDQTGALAVCGFKTDVYWLQSLAFEMLVMGGLQNVSFTRPGMGKFERELKEAAPGLLRNLDFRMCVRKG